jgi:hypothetical protein
LEHQFTLDAPGQAWVEAILAAPRTSWADGRAAVAALDVDGEFRQEIILAAGEAPVAYARFLGLLRSGPHRLRLSLDPTLSAQGAGTIAVHQVRTGSVSDASPEALAWRHAPVLHYRALHSRLDSLTTDTPLLLFYRRIAAPDGRGIEYHVVFSHEDEGTDLAGLLARWGHTTDIEWVYRIVRDAAGRVVREELQGPGHRTIPFRGEHVAGTHPVVQVATANGMVTDRVGCPFCVALAPALAQPADEPREGVQHRFPWTYRVSALEVLRQTTLATDPRPDSPEATDLRRYLFLQWKRTSGADVPLEAAAQVDGAWYTSAWGRPDFAFRGDDAESTAVRLPAGTVEEEVNAIAVGALEDPPVPAEIRLVRAFMLGDRYLPRPSFASSGLHRLREARPCTVWERAG